MLPFDVCAKRGAKLSARGTVSGWQRTGAGLCEEQVQQLCLLRFAGGWSARGGASTEQAPRAALVYCTARIVRERGKQPGGGQLCRSTCRGQRGLQTVLVASSSLQSARKAATASGTAISLGTMLV